MLQSAKQASGSGGLTKLSKEEEWEAKEVHFLDDKKVSLRLLSPNSPTLIALYFQENYELIPPLFFQRMALLQVLDLSHTSIKSLPKSLPTLVALKKLLLRGCRLFMELSPDVGKLNNLEELDLDETQIMDLPRDIGKLLNLRHLRVSFYPFSSKKRMKSNSMIHPGTISYLSKLTGLSIDVDPVDKRWDGSVEDVVKEVCNSKTLRTLSLYLPKFQLLDYTSLIYPSLSCFRFIVGHHKRRIISRVPQEVEAEFRNWDKCLKFVNGETIPNEVKGVLKYSDSFFLDQHATALNLSEFGIENMKRLKFCLLAECNKMETIIDGEMYYEGNEDEQPESHPNSAENVVLESLEYLSIHYMDNLGSIWTGSTRYGCMSKLKFLALHTCPQLSNVFSHTLLENFVNLEEFILEDCPLVTSLVSHPSVEPMMPGKFLPSLRRLLLLYLPELVSISNGLLIAPKLESVGFYNCPKLKRISKMELSSKTLKIIKGECQWWENMKWNETEWGNRLEYLMHIFSPVNTEDDVTTQLAEDRDLFEDPLQIEGLELVVEEEKLLKISTQADKGQRSDYTKEKLTGTDVKKSTPPECILPCLRTSEEKHASTEKSLAERELEFTAVQEKHASTENETSSKLTALVGQVNTLQQELETLHSQKAELEVQLEKESQAVSDYMMEMEKAKKEVVSKNEDQQRVLQEKEGLVAQMKDLESELNSLKNQKGELEEDLRRKIEENGQLREEKVGLEGQFFELEKTLAERGLEFTALQEKHASTEKSSAERALEFTALQEKHAGTENETSSKLTALVGQVNTLQQELDSLQTQRNELVLQLERDKQEFSERLTELENQKSELESQISHQQRMLEEKEEAHKKFAEEYKQVEGFYEEHKAKLEVAEKKMEEMSEEFHKTIETKSQMAADLKQIIEDLQRDLEAKAVEKDDFIKQIADHQRMLKEQEDAFNKLSEEHKQLETSFQDCKVIIEDTERKMQEMAGEHDKHVLSKDQIVADLEQIIEDLKRDLEMNGDELSTLMENVHTIEVKLRLSNQKLRVKEQLLTENEESFRKAEAKFLEEQRMLEEKITTLSETIAANNEAHCRMITDISENVNSTLTGFEAVIQKFEEGYRNYENCIEETSEELRIARHWVAETKSEKKRLINEMTNLIEQLKDQKEQGSLLREKVEKLQIKANKEEGERENLLKTVKHLEKKVEFLETVMKEKDQGILGLGEEKREAIRQLCLWIDYHRSRFDDLKEILSKTVRVQRAT